MNKTEKTIRSVIYLILLIIGSIQLYQNKTQLALVSLVAALIVGKRTV